MADNSERGKRLKELIIHSGIERKQLMQLLGVNRITLSHYENGDKIPDAKVKVLASIFGVSEKYINGETDIRNDFRYTDDVPDLAAQKTQFMRLRSLLISLGAEIKLRAKIKDVIYQYNPSKEGLTPFTILSECDDNVTDIIYEQQLAELIDLCKEDAFVYYVVTYKGISRTITYHEMQKWMKNILMHIQIQLMDLSDVTAKIDPGVLKDEIERSLDIANGIEELTDDEKMERENLNYFMDLCMYTDSIGFEGFGIPKSGIVEIKNWDVFTENQKREIAKIMMKDRKGIKLGDDMKLHYDRKNHELGDGYSSQTERDHIRKYVIEADEEANRKKD
ncbi:helix-turn-helix domain-containing protein [Butyrivibrio sp. LC3010]|uniref:helix-turn-helix domain-containing protein n=1 Tax=Butyrivibrio sp. LC3010 TaxID=1280680 RepID=UPI0003F75BCB|nr:helix-turn-helix transcriptional regulator [Butyrivibrio sp. LC3010]